MPQMGLCVSFWLICVLRVICGRCLFWTEQTAGDAAWWRLQRGGDCSGGSWTTDNADVAGGVVRVLLAYLR
ncbi:hypothetical protein, partial [Candidatus Laterigemmans baculatus]|uniref:hypothetical protein n=1 Tax=Candidatus Laterigemmans baculatus TaxID=2770505 RepID=UPI00193F7E2C